MQLCRRSGCAVARFGASASGGCGGESGAAACAARRAATLAHAWASSIESSEGRADGDAEPEVHTKPPGVPVPRRRRRPVP
eukprot:79800-Pleurochrysis_carterae.AAC.3